MTAAWSSSTKRRRSRVRLRKAATERRGARAGAKVSLLALWREGSGVPDGGVIRRGDYLELVQKLLANVADASVPRIGLAVFETTFEPPRPGMV